MSLKKVIDCIKTNKRFLITTHTNLEGDALGSELAFSRLLKKLGKGAIIINKDDLPYGYDFLPDINNIKRLKQHPKDVKFDCFVILDCSDLDRCGKVYTLNKDNKPIFNIDHHISNQEFGNVNWVEPNASSCSEMIYKLYKKLRVPFDRDTAILLYVGMLTDTGSFRYANTTSYTHQAAAELLKYNLNVGKVYRSIYENIPYQDIKVLTKILPDIRCSFKGMVAWFQIGHRILKHKKLSFDLSETLLGFARAIKDVEVAVLFKENLGVKNEIRVNLRSQGKVDVNKIAQFFGGGGHKTASGCTIKGRIEGVIKKVLNRIRKSLK